MKKLTNLYYLLSEKFIAMETVKYEIGKRHLANMMGEDPDKFTEKRIVVSYIRFIQRITFYLYI